VHSRALNPSDWVKAWNSFFLSIFNTVSFSNSTGGAATHRILTRLGSLAALHADNPKVPFE
jgi:hypothetical protein